MVDAIQNLTENTKFFLIILIYTVSVSWWASSITSKVDVQSQILNKTVLLLDTHIAECTNRRIEFVLMKNNMNRKIDELIKAIQDNEQP